MTANTTSNTDRGAVGRSAGMTRRSILRGLIPAVAAAAGAASLLGGGEASAAGANVPGGGASGRRHRRDRQDRQDRDRNAGGAPADRRRRPRRDRNSNPGPAPRPRPQPPAPPAPVVPSLLAQYSYDASGWLTVSGSGFIPNVLVTVALVDTTFPFLFSTTIDTVPGPDGSFSFTLTSVCPPSLIVTATQSGLAPVTRAVDFGIYTCLVV